jgi:origin recognition complex subunit 1
VLLDELDQLVMAKQTVLYNLFNWPTLPHSRLIVIAIANTMNLADMLPNKIQSRVGTVLATSDEVLTL